MDTKKIAWIHIRELWEYANKIQEYKEEYADIAIKKILKISMRYNIDLPKEMTQRICRKCKKLLTPSKTAETKVINKKLYLICKCGNIQRWNKINKESKKNG